MLLLLVIIFIFFIFYIKKYTNENFNNYKSVIVTPRKVLYDKIVINSFLGNSLYHNIAKNIAKKFPINNIKLSNGSKTNIYNTNQFSNHISLVQDDILFNYIKNNANNNIRYILSIGIEKFTLITPKNSKINSWHDLENKTIGTLDKNTGSYFTLNNILNSFEINTKIVTVKLNSIPSLLLNKEIDAFFIVISHPNNLFRIINKQVSIKFLSMDTLDKQILKKIFPFANKSKIDIDEYHIPTTNVINTLETRVNIICNDKLDKEHAYNFIKTIFSNLIFIKTNGTDDYKLQMQEFNPSYLYPNNTLYKLHEGVHKFYIDIGVISYIDNNYCKYSVGIQKCTNKKLNNFRLI